MLTGHTGVVLLPHQGVVLGLAVITAGRVTDDLVLETRKGRQTGDMPAERKIMMMSRCSLAWSETL